MRKIVGINGSHARIDGQPALGREESYAEDFPYNHEFGFLLTNHMPREACQERAVCRRMRTNAYWIRSHGGRERIRSHIVRRLPNPFGYRLSVRLQNKGDRYAKSGRTNH